MAGNRSGPKDWKEARRKRALELLTDGWTQSEIAEALGLSVTIVKVRVHRARLFLRKQLGDAMATLSDYQ